jgi:REP element-mobilizing transposase RayT
VPRLFHLTIASRGRLSLVLDERARRRLVLSLARVAGERLLGFSLVDEHLHTLVRTARPLVLARSIGASIRAQRPGLQLERPDLRRIDSQAYLRRVTSYLVRQPLRHDLPGHPALWTGSYLQDLVGARLLPGFSTAPLEEELSGLPLAELLLSVGLEGSALVPATLEDLARIGVAGIVDLAAGVFAAGPQPAGRARPALQAKTLAARAARATGYPPTEIARFMGLTPGNVRRIVKRTDLHPDAPEALLRRLALLERCRERPAVAVIPDWRRGAMERRSPPGA